MPAHTEAVSPPRYQALALQITTHSLSAVRDVQTAREVLQRNIERVSAAVAASVRHIADERGLAVRLVVLPEYSLTGAPSAGRFREWRAKAAIGMHGPEYEQLGRVARRLDLFLAGNAYEADDNFPDLYFQTSFVIAPEGKLALRYRRLISLYSPSPYDVWDRYLEIYGARALFPVAETAIGRVAAIASEEILYPEIARCHTMGGAEILVHSTSEMGSPQSTPKDLAKRARAAENLAYLVSANAAGVSGTALPDRSTTGMTKIIDFEGRVLAEAAPGDDSMAANATIDLAALRYRRRQCGLSNTLVRQPLQAYSQCYRTALFHASGQLGDPAVPAMETLRRTQQETIDRLARLKLI